MSELENVDLIVASKDESFGGILKLEREKKGLSIDDVSDDLHLDKKIIYALENHNLEDLPEAAFVCGYIRNYARFLKLQPEPIVEDFKKEVNLMADLNAVKSVGDISYNRQEKRSHYLIFFLLIILFVGGYLGWEYWKTQDHLMGNGNLADNFSEFTSNGDSESLSGSFALETESNQQQAQPEEVQVLETEANQESQATIEQEAPVQQEIEQVEEQNQDVIAMETTAMEMVEDVVSEVPVENIEPQTVNTELEQEVNSESTQLIEEQKKVKNQKKIKFRFSKDSWISVKDANNKSLVYDLMRAGEELELKGAVPIRVFLGDATGVSLTVEEEAFDLSSYINRKNIAKFNVN